MQFKGERMHTSGNSGFVQDTKLEKDTPVGRIQVLWHALQVSLEQLATPHSLEPLASLETPVSQVEQAQQVTPAPPASQASLAQPETLV